ncbi:hypothetical protein [Pseudoclavibacter helvolus]|uniref:hypothetical protein n=1 Tax=Pseudoclavibacter helvolus TaxID=255205 RepID=UPI003C77CDAD
MNVPVKLSLYAALLVGVFGAAFFTAQVVVEADRAGDWRPQLHQTQEVPPETDAPGGSGAHSEAPRHEEGEQ